MAIAPLAAQKRVVSIQNTGETLTNQDTAIYTTSPSLLDVPYYYSIHVQSDSLTGANAGFAYLQVSNKTAGDVWYTTQTMTIDGTGTDEALWEGILYASRVRVYFITPSGTRTIRAKVFGTLKRVY